MPQVRYLALTFICVILVYQLSTYTHYRASTPNKPPIVHSSVHDEYEDLDASQEHLKISQPSSTLIPESEQPESTIASSAPSEASSSPDVLTTVLETGSHHVFDFETALDTSMTTIWSRIGKVTSLYWTKQSEKTEAYEKGLLTHRDHDHRYNYKHFAQRRESIEDTWSKHAYLIQILMQELEKSPSERLDWLFWHDADLLMLNSLLPLEVFLPPANGKWDHINLLISNDKHGLNDGTFLVRVCEWSVYLFASGLSYPYYHPEKRLRNGEQGALQMVLADWDKFGNHTVHVPQRWFNAYHNYGIAPDIPPEWEFELDYVEPGDLLVHLPGTGDSRTAIMNEWWRKLQEDSAKWHIPYNETRYFKEIGEFWEKDAPREREREADYWRKYHVILTVGTKCDDKQREWEKTLRHTWKGNSTKEEINKAIEDKKPYWHEIKKEALREEERARKNGTHTDYITPE
ncbi:hypothetical protein LTR70_005546 [Exophiala xenobiotica]|uniref:Glycosyltransferase family 34 protein n=1 Tax=Lithohypha guttulata TaxID=1690604 RepID=A0ABR0K9J7_9EURO|nr:hypothetical protein LTR24_005237 [Lithohypha guttulata]KAK5318062.1 hypothetical protein LTR70_005546 [Exophiala xenobiotica]